MNVSSCVSYMKIANIALVDKKETNWTKNYYCPDSIFKPLK